MAPTVSQWQQQSVQGARMASQMVFTGAAGCPTFSPNTFKADMCCLCQNKIQSHAGATDNQVQVASFTR